MCCTFLSCLPSGGCQQPPPPAPRPHHNSCLSSCRRCLLRVSVPWGHHGCCSEFPSQALFPGVLWAMLFSVSQGQTWNMFFQILALLGRGQQIALKPLHFHTIIKRNMVIRLPLPGARNPGSLCSKHVPKSWGPDSQGHQRSGDDLPGDREARVTT